MAVELRNHIGQALELRLPATLVFDYPTIEALHSYLLDEWLRDDEQASPAATVPTTESPRPAAFPAGDGTESDDEIAEMLAEGGLFRK